MKKSNVKSVKIKPIKITLGEKEYDFILDLNAFAELEDEFGSIQELMYAVDRGSMKAIRGVIWAGLQGNENPPTIKQVGANIQINQIEELSKVIVEGMGISLPEVDEADPN